MSQRVGVLLPTIRDEDFLAAMKEELQGKGWRIPQDLEIQVRIATQGSTEQMRELVEDLNRADPSLLVTASSPAALAMARSTTRTPIVFVNVFDPVVLGLVESIERPGKNCTGVVGFPPDMAGRWVRKLKELVPSLTKVGLMYNPETAATMMPSHRPAATNAAAELGLEFVEVPIARIDDLEGILAPLAERPGCGLVVAPSTFMPTHREVLVPAINRHRLPALYGISPMVHAGGLASFGPDIEAQWRAAAAHVDALLRGAAAETLPVQFAPKTVLTLNLKTASALGIEIPDHLRQQADVVS